MGTTKEFHWGYSCSFCGGETYEYQAYRRVIRIEGEGVPRNGELYDKPYRHKMIDEVFSRRGILHAAQERELLIEGMDVKELADLARQGNLAYQQVFEEFGSCLA
ncbi:hypothetical protein MHH52_17325 [Paenibacillus sp. FSL K6-0276]|uniref:hypothetical protein n=1 Tax=Paenibacillus sp. FSL K6-0276 TaxID=2921450 RepID=UPI0030EDD097